MVGGGELEYKFDHLAIEKNEMAGFDEFLNFTGIGVRLPVKTRIY